jgi:hypothetical protein
MSNGTQQKFSVDLSQLESLVCPCGSTLYQKAHEIKRVPALLSPTGKSAVIWVEVGAVCCACGSFATMQQISETEKQIKLVETTEVDS